MFLAESSNDEMFLVGKFGVQKIEMENRCPCWWGGPQCLNHPNRFRQIQKANNCGQTGNKRWYEAMTNELWSAWEWIYWFTLLDVPSLKYWITVGACALFTWGSMLPVGYIRYFPMWKIKMIKEHQIYNILHTFNNEWLSHWQARGIRTSSRQLRQRECALKGNCGTGCGKTLISDCCSRCVCSASQSHISSHVLDRWPEVCQTSSFLRSISYCGRLGGWLENQASTATVCPSPRAEVQLGMMERAGLPRRAKSQALQRMMQKKKGARLEGFQRYPKIMGMGWLLTFRQQMFDWPIVACPIPWLIIHRFSWPGSSWHRSSQVHSSLACWWGHLAKGRGGNMNPHDQVYQSSKR